MDQGVTSDEEQLRYNRRLKKAILDVMFRDVETFYVHCMPNALLEIGSRGLVEKESKEGIILVFGPYSTRHLSWDDNLIYCDMQFGRWEQVAIPYECIARIFDKSGQVIMQWAVLTAPEGEQSSEPRPPAPEKSAPERAPGVVPVEEHRVIQVDFTKKKKS